MYAWYCTKDKRRAVHALGHLQALGKWSHIVVID